MNFHCGKPSKHRRFQKSKLTPIYSPSYCKPSSDLSLQEVQSAAWLVSVWPVDQPHWELVRSTEPQLHLRHSEP